MLALMTFQDAWTGHHVLVNSDNSGAVGVFTRRHSSNEMTGAMLTFAVDLCTTRNICLRLSWIPGSSNVAADPISRANFESKLLAMCYYKCLPNIKVNGQVF